MSTLNREALQDILEVILGTENVYFQPPESLKLVYPCILYSRTGRDTKFAADNPYINTIQYQVIVIDKDPDSLITDKVAMLPRCIFDRHYVSNNLNHDVYNIYY